MARSPSLLLVVAHLPSKKHDGPGSQLAECWELAAQVRAAEAVFEHSRTLVVGDFNVNPFEPAMLDATGLHCESSRNIARKGSRIVNGQARLFFYNPMWNFFGDANAGPGGTYFHRTSQRVRISWNIFDQVLVRPALLDWFATTELEILTGDEESSFLTESGTPTRSNGSDHLPILFRLDLPAEN